MAREAVAVILDRVIVRPDRGADRTDKHLARRDVLGGIELEIAARASCLDQLGIGEGELVPDGECHRRRASLVSALVLSMASTITRSSRSGWLAL